MKLEANVKFYISGKEFSVPADDISPETTLNTYLRDYIHLTGTKRMCLEGGCGVCIVAVEKEDLDGNKRVFVINSCLVSIYSCHGWKIHTIEGIGNPLIGFHPIQKLLAENNGTQCGFCSPGMVMNMFALHESGPITQAQIENSFGGNICRCTGYRPILTAFKKLASDADPEEKLFIDIEDLKSCNSAENCNKNCKSPCHTKQVPQLFVLDKSKWLKVYFIHDLLQTLRTLGTKTYMIVAGNTARGVYYQTSIPDIYIDVSSVKELITFTVTQDTLILGGNITLTMCMELFYKVAKKNVKFSYLAKMADHIDLVAHVPVRNIGTIAGNLMIKYYHNEFPSDIFLILETANATLIIIDEEENEITMSPQNFLQFDMNKKVIKQIVLHALDSSYHYLSYKIMIRAQNSHALVDSGYLFKLNENGIVQSANIIYGGISPTFVHASKTETLLKGKNLFNNDVLQSAFQSLDQEINPAEEPEMVEGGPAFRKQLAIDLFYKYVLNIAPNNKVSPKNKSGGSLLERPVSTGIQQFGSNKNDYPVSQPINKVEALAQTSGQAEYIADIPDRPRQLHAALVTADIIAGSTIISIDATKALSVPGVVTFYDKKDIPGKNTFTPLSAGPPILVEEELFCSGVVQYYSQPVGVIVADTYETAIKAAQMVAITFESPKQKPYLNTRQVLERKALNRVEHQTSVVPKSRGTDIKHILKGEVELRQQYHYHMEVQNCNVVPTEDGLDMFPSTQWIDNSQCAAAAALDIPSQTIDVFVRRLGGAYGAKITRSALLSTACSLAAHKLKKPVKLWMPFIQNMDVIGKRHPLLVKYEVAVNDKGVIQYLNADLYSDEGQGGINEPINDFIVDMFQNAYNIDTWTFDTYAVFTDTYGNCFARAPGSLPAMGGIEAIMDHIAATLNLDPIMVRKANLDNKKYPKTLPMYNELIKTADVENRKKDIKIFNEANRWKKKGLSVIPMEWNMNVYLKYSVLVSIFHCNGGVGISHGGIEMGQGINTKVVQVCAWKFGIPVEKVSVKPTYSLITANNDTTGGSMTTEAIIFALLNSCDILLNRMKPIKEKNKNATWEELVQLSYNANVHLTATTHYKDENGKGVPVYPIYGVCATEVEVDILTGQHQILRVDIIEDVGDSISPLLDIGQIEGAFVMGIGYYTTEEIIFDPDGKLLTNRTWTYKPPGAKDIPIDFRVTIPSNNPNPVGVLHSKAVSEPPMCLSVSVPLAIRNAVGSARIENDSSKPVWYPINGPSTVENTLLNTLNNYRNFNL